MLAVNGLSRVKVASAMPVLTMSVGKVKDVLTIKFCSKAGIMTGDNFISDIASCKDSIGVELVLPAIEVLELIPWM